MGNESMGGVRATGHGGASLLPPCLSGMEAARERGQSPDSGPLARAVALGLNADWTPEGDGQCKGSDTGRMHGAMEGLKCKDRASHVALLGRQSELGFDCGRSA